MPILSNSFATPAILPTDLGPSEGDIPEADEREAGEDNPAEDDAAVTPEIAVIPLPVGGNRDEPDVRRLLNSYSPFSR